MEEIKKEIKKLKNGKADKKDYQALKRTVEDVQKNVETVKAMGETNKSISEQSLHSSQENYKLLKKVNKIVEKLDTIVDGNTETLTPSMKAQSAEMWKVYDKGKQTFEYLSEMDPDAAKLLAEISKDSMKTLIQMIKIWTAIVVLFSIFGITSLFTAISMYMVLKELFF